MGALITAPRGKCNMYLLCIFVTVFKLSCSSLKHSKLVTSLVHEIAKPMLILQAVVPRTTAFSSTLLKLFYRATLYKAHPQAHLSLVVDTAPCLRYVSHTPAVVCLSLVLFEFRPPRPEVDFRPHNHTQPTGEQTPPSLLLLPHCCAVGPHGHIGSCTHAYRHSMRALGRRAPTRCVSRCAVSCPSESEERKTTFAACTLIASPPSSSEVRSRPFPLLSLILFHAFHKSR